MAAREGFGRRGWRIAAALALVMGAAPTANAGLMLANSPSQVGGVHFSAWDPGISGSTVPFSVPVGGRQVTISATQNTPHIALGDNLAPAAIHYATPPPEIFASVAPFGPNTVILEMAFRFDTPVQAFGANVLARARGGFTSEIALEAYDPGGASLGKFQLAFGSGGLLGGSSTALLSLRFVA